MTKFKFCEGSPNCSVCGGAHEQDSVQRCPTKRRPVTAESLQARLENKNRTSRKGLGTFVASCLSAIGIKKKPGGCSACNSREMKLNIVGWTVAFLFKHPFLFLTNIIKLVKYRKFKPSKRKRQKKLEQYEASLTQEQKAERCRVKAERAKKLGLGVDK